MLICLTKKNVRRKRKRKKEREFICKLKEGNLKLCERKFLENSCESIDTSKILQTFMAHCCEIMQISVYFYEFLVNLIDNFKISIETCKSLQILLKIFAKSFVSIVLMRYKYKLIMCDFPLLCVKNRIEISSLYY